MQTRASFDVYLLCWATCRGGFLVHVVLIVGLLVVDGSRSRGIDCSFDLVRENVFFV